LLGTQYTQTDAWQTKSDINGIVKSALAGGLPDKQIKTVEKYIKNVARKFLFWIYGNYPAVKPNVQSFVIELEN